MTRVFCLLLLLVLSATPALADLSFGVVPARDSLIQNKQQAEALASYLETRLQQPVKLRIFNSESLLHKWLNRYREVDIAVISNAYYDSKRQGEFILLVDYQPAADSRRKPSILVGRQGLAQETQQELRDVLFVMDTDESGARLLKQMQLQSFSAPGTRVVLSRPPAPPKKSPKVIAQPKPKPAKPKIDSQAVVQKAVTPEEQPSAVTRIETTKIVDVAVSEPDPVSSPVPVSPSVPAAPVVEQTAPVETAVPVSKKPVSDISPKAISPATTSPATLPDGNKSAYSRKVQQAKAEPPEGSGSGRKYLIAIATVLLVGAGIKLFLIYQRRPRQRPAIPSSQLRMHHDWSELHQGQPSEISATEVTAPTAPPQADPLQERDEPTPVPQEPLETAPTKVEEPATNTPYRVPEESTAGGVPQGLPSGLLQLDGHLGPRQIPAMLQLIAASGQSGTLTVSASHNEKRLTFSRGKITTASSRNISNQNQSGFLMNKLGYLLVRQGKITEEQRDQALVMCEGDTKLRLGEALLKMGALKRVELQKSLCDQAKMILHSLIVFPEGRFEFTGGDAQIPPEDNLRLSVNEFLKEAAAHQNEWKNIREMIPSLDTVLEFAPGGQEKVGSGRMTVHQKFVLSLIDGKRPIRDVCITATMLDYELYRFLYLMTKANILQRASV